MSEQLRTNIQLTPQERLAKARDEVKAAELAIMEEARAERARLRAAEEAKVLALKARLAEETGLTKHPKLEKVWELAWDHGHSYGLADVELYFREYAELVK